MSSSLSLTQSDIKTQINNYVTSICPPKTLEEAMKHDYKFWDTQPMPKLDEVIALNGPVTDQEEEVRATAYTLPQGFSWVTYDMNSINVTDLLEISEFLNKHHIEEAKNRIRRVYTPEHIKWRFNYQSQGFCVVVKIEKTGALVGFLGGIISKTKVGQHILDTVETSLLTVHYKLRGKRLTTVLINEFTRQARLKGVSKGIFSTQNYLPKPFCTTQLFNRPLNSDKLIKANFMTAVGNVSAEDLTRTFRLPKRTQNQNFVPMSREHIDSAYDVFNNYMSRYQVHPIFSKDQFIQRFGNPADLDPNTDESKLVYHSSMDQVKTYVIIDENNQVTDMISYYRMTSRVINKDGHSDINTAYMNYYTGNQETAYRIVKDMMIVARDNGIDLLYTLDNLENNFLLKELNFEEGYKTHLHYYIYNWKSPTQPAHCVGLTMY